MTFMWLGSGFLKIVEWPELTNVHHKFNLMPIFKIVRIFAYKCDSIILHFDPINIYMNLIYKTIFQDKN